VHLSNSSLAIGTREERVPFSCDDQSVPVAHSDPLIDAMPRIDGEVVVDPTIVASLRPLGRLDSTPPAAI
jgi:hypothetical protein